jgi:hypothetical protein
VRHSLGLDFFVDQAEVAVMVQHGFDPVSRHLVVASEARVPIASAADRPTASRKPPPVLLGRPRRLPVDFGRA